MFQKTAEQLQSEVECCKTFEEKLQLIQANRYFVSNVTLRRYNCLDELMIRTTSLPKDSSIKERIYCVLNNIDERPICCVCNKNRVYFDRKHNCYKDTCSLNCLLKSPSHIQRMIDKYGTPSPNSSPIVKQKKIDKLLDSYGVTNAFQIPAVKEHARQKSLEEHGVEHWTNLEQSHATYKAKTGYDNPSKDPIVKQKKEDTSVTRYGVKNISQLDFVKQKKAETCFKNNGVHSGFHVKTAKRISYSSISSLNKKVYEFLDILKIPYHAERRIYTESGKYWSYDIEILEQKIFIEINGDFWHANPMKYKADDILNFPHIGKIQVADIWKHDQLKYEQACKNGYAVIYIWETDLKQMSVDMFKSWLQENSVRI